MLDNNEAASFVLWSFGSQACERTFSTVINFSMLGLLQCLHKLHIQEELQSATAKKEHGIKFPRQEVFGNKKDGSKNTLFHISQENNLISILEKAERKLPSSALASANAEVNEGQNGRQRTRGSYTKLSAEVKAELGKGCCSYFMEMHRSQSIIFKRRRGSTYFRTAIAKVYSQNQVFPFIRENLIPRKCPAIRYISARPGKLLACNGSISMEFFTSQEHLKVLQFGLIKDILIVNATLPIGF